MNWPLINTLILGTAIVAFGIALWRFRIESKTWTGPSHAARFDSLEEDVRAVQGNHRALRRDVDGWHREMADVLDRISREVQVIAKNGAKEHPLEDELKHIEDRLLDVEQVVASMPCQPQCKPIKSQD